MEVQTTQDQPVFNAINLNIKITSQDEYELLFKLFAMDSRIPNLMRSAGEISIEQSPVLSKMMSKVYDSLHNLS